MAVVPDAMRFCFDVCTRARRSRARSWRSTRSPARSRCRTLRRRETELPDALPLCACGSAEVELAAGNELLIKEVEVT